MRCFSKGILALAVIAAGVVALTGARARATIYTEDATTVFNTSNSPTTTGSDATATFSDVAGGVQMTLALSLPSEPSFYHLTTWWINMTSAAATTYNGTMTFAEQSASAGLTIPTVHQSSSAQPFASQADDAGYYDAWLDGFGNSFVSGDAITYLITSSTAGLSAADFVNLSSTTQHSYTAPPPSSNDGNYYTAALIFGGSSEESQDYYVGATTAVPSVGTPPVPLPAAALLFPIGAALAAVTARKKLNLV